METETSFDDSHTGRWTHEEHETFLTGLREHGRDWKQIAIMIPSRTVVQIRTHAQKYFQKLAKEEGLEVAETMFRGGYGNSSYTRDKLLLGLHTLGGIPEKDEDGNIIITKRTSSRIAQKKQQKETEAEQNAAAIIAQAKNTTVDDDDETTDLEQRTIDGTNSSTGTIIPRKLSNLSSMLKESRSSRNHVGRPSKRERKNSLSTVSSNFSFATHGSNRPPTAYQPPEQYTMIDNDGYDEYGFYHGPPSALVSALVSPHESSSASSVLTIGQSSTLSSPTVLIVEGEETFDTEEHRKYRSTKSKVMKINNSLHPVYPNDHPLIEVVAPSSKLPSNPSYYHPNVYTVPRKGSADESMETSPVSTVYVTSKNGTVTDEHTVTAPTSPTAGDNDYRVRTFVPPCPGKKVPVTMTTNYGNVQERDEPLTYGGGNTYGPLNHGSTKIKNILLPTTIPSLVIPTPVTDNTSGTNLTNSHHNNSTATTTITTTITTTNDSTPSSSSPSVPAPVPPVVLTSLPQSHPVFWENLLAATPRGLQAALLLANHILCSPTATLITPQGTPSVRLRTMTQGVTTMDVEPPSSSSASFSHSTTTIPSSDVSSTLASAATGNNTNTQYISLMIPIDVLRSTNGNNNVNYSNLLSRLAPSSFPTTTTTTTSSTPTLTTTTTTTNGTTPSSLNTTVLLPSSVTSSNVITPNHYGQVHNDENNHNNYTKTIVLGGTHN